MNASCFCLLRRSIHPLAAPLGVLGLLALVACSDKAAGGPKGQEAVPVKAAAVVRRDVPVQVRAVGHVEPVTTVTVRSQVTGILDRIHIREGQTVAAGALLFEIDPRPYRAALAEAEARLERDRALARKAAEDVKRNADLVKKEYITQEQYASIQANAQALDAVVKADEAAVEGARLDLGYCAIRSPLAGRTGALPVHAGNLVKANDQALVVIHQVRPVYVTFAVPERDLDRIRLAMAAGPVPVEAAPPEGGAPSAGTLNFVDNAVDPATGTIQMKALLPNDDDRLWPGQFVTATLTLSTLAGAAVVPSQAVQTGQQGTFVYVVKPDRTVEFRPVRTGAALDGLVVVETGAAPGETVVTDGHLRLVPGAAVNVLEGTPAP
jgi:multidrug efflux system membrane fusion protein